MPLYRYAQLPDVLTVTENEEDCEAVGALLRDTIALALDDLTRMRSREGEALKADLTVHLKLLESLRQRILARAPGVVEDYRQRLTQRIAGAWRDGDRFLPRGAGGGHLCRSRRHR